MNNLNSSHSPHISLSVTRKMLKREFHYVYTPFLWQPQSFAFSRLLSSIAKFLVSLIAFVSRSFLAFAYFCLFLGSKTWLSLSTAYLEPSVRLTGLNRSVFLSHPWSWEDSCKKGGRNGKKQENTWWEGRKYHERGDHLQPFQSQQLSLRQRLLLIQSPVHSETARPSLHAPKPSSTSTL